MKIKSGVRRIALAAGGAGVVAGVAIAVPGTASAATAVIGAGNIELCANGNYTAQMEFQGTINNGATLKETFTSKVPQGTCQVFSVPSFSQAEITFGFFNTHPDQRFTVGSSVAQPGGPAQLIRAEGTTTDPTFKDTTF